MKTLFLGILVFYLPFQIGVNNFAVTSLFVQNAYSQEIQPEYESVQEDFTKENKQDGIDKFVSSTEENYLEKRKAKNEGTRYFPIYKHLRFQKITEEEKTIYRLTYSKKKEKKRKIL